MVNSVYAKHLRYSISKFANLNFLKNLGTPLDWIGFGFGDFKPAYGRR